MRVASGARVVGGGEKPSRGVRGEPRASCPRRDVAVAPRDSRLIIIIIVVVAVVPSLRRTRCKII